MPYFAVWFLFGNLNFYLIGKPKSALASFNFPHDAVRDRCFNIGQDPFRAMSCGVKEES
jgi:hypothetical protein